MLIQRKIGKSWQKYLKSRSLVYCLLFISTIGIVINNLAIAAIPILIIALACYIYILQFLQNREFNITSRLHKKIASEVPISLLLLKVHLKL